MTTTNRFESTVDEQLGALSFGELRRPIQWLVRHSIIRDPRYPSPPDAIAESSQDGSPPDEYAVELGRQAFRRVQDGDEGIIESLRNLAESAEAP